MGTRPTVFHKGDLDYRYVHLFSHLSRAVIEMLILVSYNVFGRVDDADGNEMCDLSVQVGGKGPTHPLYPLL